MTEPASLSTSSQSVKSLSVGLQRIDHVGVAVPDLDTAIAFYEGTFGMTCVHVETNEEQGVREAMMQVAPGVEGGAIQLLAPLRPDSAIGKFLDRSGPGMQQLAFTVVDIDATCAALRERGMRLLYETPRRGTANSRINFVHPKDAGGVLVELVQPAADH
ncbi:methylmalonyl-CoA epimerase [Catellatospora sp. TT07R-123]|uniref:methylmalonyl-CoA epimerase n=1 Tax=Catellatospora sp. TT07R-123 TaxID=2733863 RepID=UPI001B12502D|nr:methylmalonyl-CoA epimerase [Catellatospora sp. TT07R-123]GHJ49983.1 methylmalonyl-CoA epimerase [Catellatospora sp. TT07R-123]